MELEVSGHTAFKTYCIRERCICENICFKESFYILTLTYLSNCKCIYISLDMWQEHSISQGLCLLFIQFFQGYIPVKLSRAQFVYLFATCIHIFSSLHFLAPVNKNMSLSSEPFFEKNLLCTWNHLTEPSHLFTGRAFKVVLETVHLALNTANLAIAKGSIHYNKKSKIVPRRTTNLPLFALHKRLL